MMSCQDSRRETVSRARRLRREGVASVSDADADSSADADSPADADAKISGLAG